MGYVNFQATLNFHFQNITTCCFHVIDASDKFTLQAGLIDVVLYPLGYVFTYMNPVFSVNGKSAPRLKNVLVIKPRHPATPITCAGNIRQLDCILLKYHDLLLAIYINGHLMWMKIFCDDIA